MWHFGKQFRSDYGGVGWWLNQMILKTSSSLKDSVFLSLQHLYSIFDGHMCIHCIQALSSCFGPSFSAWNNLLQLICRGKNPSLRPHMQADSTWVIPQLCARSLPQRGAARLLLSSALVRIVQPSVEGNLQFQEQEMKIIFSKTFRQCCLQ